MIDPDSIKIDESFTYVRLSGHPVSVSSIADPLAPDEPRVWRGHTKASSTDSHRLDVEAVSRGGWGFAFIETADDELVEALEDEGHEPLAPGDFEALLDKAPEYTYLRTGKPRTATRAERKYRSLSIVDVDEIETEDESE